MTDEQTAIYETLAPGEVLILSMTNGQVEYLSNIGGIAEVRFARRGN